MSARPLLSVLVVAILMQTPMAQAADAWAPAAVFATAATSDAASLAVIAWTPGAVAADSYRVYGVEGGSLVLLVTATDLTTTAPAGFATYAVSGVKNGVESDPTFAVFVPCIDVELHPPNASWGNCGALAPVIVSTRP